MFTDVQDESFNELKAKFETFNSGSAKVGPVDLEVQVTILSLELVLFPSLSLYLPIRC